MIDTVYFLSIINVGGAERGIFLFNGRKIL